MTPIDWATPYVKQNGEMHVAGGKCMKTIERFSDLLSYHSVESWRDRIFQIGNEMGYERVLLAIVPTLQTPAESPFAFLHHNYPSRWLNKYDEEKMGHIDPVVSHCVAKSIPLIWSPDIFSTHRQHEMYEEACGYGIRAGVTLPIHGARGEFGVLCLVSATMPDKRFANESMRNIPALALFRDFISETSSQFMQHPAKGEQTVTLTPCELECLKWGAAGKSSWDIGRILHCSEAAVNFHFANIRRKFNTGSRHQAAIKAIRMGIISPS